MGPSERSTRIAIHSAGLATVVLSLAAWTYWFYPLLGLDYASVLPAMYEMRDAFARFGRLDVDFSPFRCLGLPVFANPNAFVWSVYHPFALVVAELRAVLAGGATILAFAYVGCVALLRGLGLGTGLAAGFAVAWCLQGFCASHLLAGHVSYLQLALQPLLLWLLLQKTSSWIARGAAAFWLAHLVYTAGYYLLLTGIPSLLLAAFVIERLVPRRLDARGLGGVRTMVWNLAIVGPLALAMSAPKMLAVLDFTAMFPRLTQLDRIATWKALVYTASQYLVPVPYDARRFTGWWYGNWEAYEMILPGVAYWLAWTVWTRRRDVPVARVGGIVALLLAVGTVLSSGVLGPVFSALPLLQSLHVNPRWNALVLLPYFALVVGVAAALPASARPSTPWIAALWLLAVVVPFQLTDRREMQIEYTDGQGIDTGRHRLGFCYEPIFGYRLEHFPVKGQVDFTSDVLADPRCYLRSAACKPGTLLAAGPDREALERYALRDARAPVALLKWPALAAYLAGFGCALAWLWQALAGVWRDDREPAPEQTTAKRGTRPPRGKPRRS
jgi:hypothetical protein